MDIEAYNAAWLQAWTDKDTEKLLTSTAANRSSSKAYFDTAIISFPLCETSVAITFCNQFGLRRARGLR